MAVVVSELFPNPSGADKGREWVELYNAGSEPVSIAGWSLIFGKSSVAVPQITIEPDAFVIVPIPASFSLRNTDGSLVLADSVRVVRDRAAFTGPAPENQSFSRFGDLWLWTVPSPRASVSLQSVLIQPTHRAPAAISRTLAPFDVVGYLVGTALTLTALCVVWYRYAIQHQNTYRVSQHSLRDF